MWRRFQRFTTIFRQATPYIAGLIWVMLVSSSMCLKFFSKGVSEECEAVAVEWTRRCVTEREGLSLYEAELRSIFGLLAYVCVLVGWIILAYATVWLVPRILSLLI
jgi:hypothetical protein